MPLALLAFSLTIVVGFSVTVDCFGNPVEIRDLWKNGGLDEGKARYRRMLRNGRRTRVELLLAHAQNSPLAG